MNTRPYESRVDDAITSIADGAHRMVTNTEDMSHRVNHRVRDTGAQALAAERRLAHSTDRYLHRHPFVVVGLAIGAGMLIHGIWRGVKEGIK